MAGSCPVRGGLLAALRAARVLGLAPVRIVERTGDDRVVVTACGAAYGYVLTGAVALLATLVSVFSTYRSLAGGQRNYRWQAALLLEALAAALLLAAAGAGGARRVVRLISFVNEIQTLNTVNKIDRLPNEWCGECWVWTTVAAGVAVQGVSLASVAYFTRYDASSVLFYACTNLPNVFKPVLVLHLVCLATLLRSSLEAARDRLEEAELELGTGEEYDNAAYKKAYEAVRCANRSYLVACSLVRRLSSQEGPLVLLLLVAAAVRTLRSIYLIMSTLYVPGTTSISLVRALFAAVAVAWILFEILLLVMITEAWSRVADTMSSLPPLVGSLLQLAAPGGALANQLGGLAGSLELGAAWLTPLDICTFSRSFTIALLSFYYTAGAVMRQFNLKDVV